LHPLESADLSRRTPIGDYGASESNLPDGWIDGDIPTLLQSCRRPKLAGGCRYLPLLKMIDALRRLSGEVIRNWKSIQ